MRAEIAMKVMELSYSSDIDGMKEEIAALRAYALELQHEVTKDKLACYEAEQKYNALVGGVGVNRIEMKGDPKNPQPGDHFPVKVGEKWYDTVIDEHGTQRFVENGAVNAFVDHGLAMFEEYWMKQRIADHPAVYSMNEAVVDYKCGKWSKEEMIDFYTMIGYSVGGFGSMSIAEDVEIINPLWEE